MRDKGLDLAESLLVNHEKLAYFHPTTLNTIRVVTISRNNKTAFLFAGLRVGAKGATIDNLSQGGTVACVDIKCGKLIGSFYSKRSGRQSSSLEGYNAMGYQLPFWNETIKTLEEATKVITQMEIIAWDIAITPNGPAIVEGNESFTLTI